MASLEQELEPGEWFIFSGRTHWIRYLMPALPLALGAFLASAGHAIGAGVLTVVGLGIAVPLVLETLRSRFIVTNRRLILKRGLLTPSIEYVPLAQIASIELQQDGIGQWIKAGRILLATTDGKQRALPWMQRARTFRRLALEQQKAARTLEAQAASSG